MTQEEKQILLKDLCARLPYGVNVYCEWNYLDGERWNDSGILLDIDLLKGTILFKRSSCNCTRIPFNRIDGVVKPYLRPMSSMTEEEAITIFKIIYGDDTEFSSVEVSDNCIEIWDYDYNEDGFSERTVCTIYFEEIVCSMEVLDYILSRHFDVPRWNESENAYKTMIEIGLALEASDGMYNF